MMVTRCAVTSGEPRSMVGYLALPRPRDLTKGLIAPVGFGIGAIGAGGVDRDKLVRAAVVWVLMELMVYQARYQWNDILGFVADQSHPERGGPRKASGPAGGSAF